MKEVLLAVAFGRSCASVLRAVSPDLGFRARGFEVSLKVLDADRAVSARVCTSSGLGCSASRRCGGRLKNQATHTHQVMY